MTKIDFGQQNRAYISDYIKFADAKAGAALALVLAVASAATAFADHTISDFKSAAPVFSVLGVVIALPLVVSTVIAILYAILAISPKVTPAESSLASFPDIAEMSHADYLGACRVMTEDSEIDAYASVNSRLATIAMSKYSAIADTIWWLRVQVLSAYCAAILCGVVRTLSDH